MKLFFITHHRKFKAINLRPGFFSRYLAKRGHDITVLCVADRARWAVRQYDENGVRFIEMPDLLFGNLRSGWDPWSTLRRCVYTLRHTEVDLIHAFETRPATIYPVKCLLARRPVPLVIDWIDWYGRGGLITEQRPRWYQLLFGPIETYYEEHFHTLADANTVITHALGDRAERLGVQREAIHWIPVGAPVDMIEAKPRNLYRHQFGLSPEQFVVCFSAMDVRIDADLVFEAIREVAASHPDVFLIMTGLPSPALEDMADRIGIRKYYQHYGLLPHDQFLELLCCADIFLLPYKDKVANRGRWPGKIGNYMAAGRPTISNPVGEMKTLFGADDIGLLADETPADFARKIVQLKHDPDLCGRLGQNARRVAEQKLSWDLIAEKLERVYANAVQRFRASHRVAV